MELVSGIVSDVERGASVSGHVGKNGGSTHTKQMTNFEVSERPMVMTSGSLVPLKDGHDVILVGQALSNGQTNVIYMHNNTNGVGWLSPSYGKAGNALVIVIGLMLGFLILPLGLCILGIVNIRKGNKAKKMVQDFSIRSDIRS